MDFTQLNKRFAQSFNEQKSLLKKLMAGKTVNCKECNQAITLHFDNDKGTAIAKCPQGCTNIQLELH